MSTLPLLLTFIALVGAGPTAPTANQRQIGKITDTFLYNLNVYAAQRDSPDGQTALNRTLGHFYTNEKGVTKVRSIRNCGYESKNDEFTWDPSDEFIVSQGSPLEQFSNTEIPHLIRQIDATGFKVSGMYQTERANDGESTVVKGNWVASQTGTEKTMDCPVAFQFKEKEEQMGLTGILMDCPTCDFGEVRYPSFLRNEFPVHF